MSLDREVLRGEVREEAHSGYKLHKITTPDGAVVREYVSPEGKVFAISWHARVIPDLAQLLGSYFPRVQQAAQTEAHRGGPLLAVSYQLSAFS